MPPMLQKSTNMKSVKTKGKKRLPASPTLSRSMLETNS